MNRFPAWILRAGKVLRWGLGFGVVLWAQAAEPPARPVPPLPPLPPSPVAFFRQLIDMTPADRAAALAARPEAQRTALAARLGDYEALPAAIREERLRATDLYWHLQQLLRRDPADRAALVAAAPANLQSLLIERLALWDRLSPEDQTALLEHERALRHLARWRNAPPPPPLPGVATNASLLPGPAVPLRLQAELRRFDGLSPERWQTVHEHWQRFFEAPSTRRDRALQAMTEDERLEMTRVLERFRRLAPAQRRACIDAFTRIAALPAGERADFFRRAERWESLSAEDRRAWRRIVAELPLAPPLPLDPYQPPLPPLPKPRAAVSGSNHAVGN